MSHLAAWIPALLSLIFTMMVSICFFGFAIYRLNTSIVEDSSRRLIETEAATRQISDLTKLLHYIMTEAEEKDAVINEKDAAIEERDALIEAKELIISKEQIQITNLTQRLRKEAAKAKTDQGEIRNLKSKLKNATASAYKAAATEDTIINQNAAMIDKETMANQIIKNLQASLAAAGREAHDWRTEAYIAIVRKMPPSQRGLSLFRMDPRNFMPRVPIMRAYNPSDNIFGPAGAPSFSTNALPYPFPAPASALGPDTHMGNWVAFKDCPREGGELD